MSALKRISTRKRRTKVDQVGFSSLPEQVHRKSLKKGFEFTLLVVGDSGLGKSTLVNSLFMTDLYSERNLDTVSDRIKKTVAITSRTAELEEKGVRLKLTVVDTPGFGDSINGQDCWKPIEDYIDRQFHSYYQHESGYGIERKKLQDTRIHCCLYFIPPHVRGLRPIDIQTMKSLQTRVNVVPLIAKADSLTKKELEQLKKNILADIETYDVKIYEFPLCDSDDEESFKNMDQEIKNAIPFGVIGSNTVIESGNKRIRGRVYPWGIIDIESDSCDFSKLRMFLCSSHMQDLKDLTHDVHYENYRSEYLKTQKNDDSHGRINSNTLIRGVKLTNEETDNLLHQKDAELKKMRELLLKMKINMNNNNVNDITESTSNCSNTNTLKSFGYGNANASYQQCNNKAVSTNKHSNGNPQSYGNTSNTSNMSNNRANVNNNYSNFVTYNGITNSTPI